MREGETALLSGLMAPLQILALQQEERQTRQKLGRIIASPRCLTRSPPRSHRIRG